ncbi:MAG: hypothetical protein IT340_20140 [Chloroflexi bacterium]|nr:hypothetical protein [Chloroflexota bacterium]
MSVLPLDPLAKVTREARGAASAIVTAFCAAYAAAAPEQQTACPYVVVENVALQPFRIAERSSRLHQRHGATLARLVTIGDEQRVIWCRSAGSLAALNQWADILSAPASEEVPRD